MKTPKSARLSANIVKIPLLTFIRFSSQAPLVRFQETIGGGSPAAEQFNDKSSPAVLLTFGGGFEMNFGADQTNSEEAADVSPNGFFAWQT